MDHTSEVEVSASGLFDAALHYRTIGFSVVPVRGKQARVKWRSAPPPEPESIASIWRDPGNDRFGDHPG